MTHFVKLLLLILWIGCVQSTISASAQPPPSDNLDLMTVENLTFYRDEWTTGGPKRLQFNCIYSGDEGGKCPEELTKVLCTNNDYRKFDKVNSTSLDWSCKSDELYGTFYYFKENDSNVQCEEVSRTTTERNVIRGSCSATFTVGYKWFEANLFALICWFGGILFFILFILSCAGFILNLIDKRSKRSDYSSV